MTEICCHFDGGNVTLLRVIPLVIRTLSARYDAVIHIFPSKRQEILRWE